MTWHSSTGATATDRDETIFLLQQHQNRWAPPEDRWEWWQAELFYECRRRHLIEQAGCSVCGNYYGHVGIMV